MMMMRNMVRTGLFVILLSAAPAAAAEDTATPTSEESFEASLTQAVEDKTSKVGEPIEMKLTVTHPAGAEVFAPEVTGNPRWEIVRATRQSRADGESSTTTKIDLTLMVWRPGSTTLPPMEVQVTTPDGRQATLKTEAVSRKILSTLPLDAEPELANPSPPRAIFIQDRTPLWVGLGAGAIALTALLTFWLMRRRLAGIAPEIAPTPIHVVALERLSGLATEDLSDRPAYLSFYISMSETIRVYLGKLHGFPGGELTTTEIMDRLEGVTWPRGLDAADIQTWLEHCDRVKYTTHTPEIGRAEGALRTAFSVVELTRRHEEALRAAAAVTPPEPEGLEAYRETPKAAPKKTEEAPAPTQEAKERFEEKVDEEASEDLAAREALGATALGAFSFQEVATLLEGEPLDAPEEDAPEEDAPEEKVPVEGVPEEGPSGDLEDDGEEEERA